MFYVLHVLATNFRSTTFKNSNFFFENFDGKVTCRSNTFHYLHRNYFYTDCFLKAALFDIATLYYVTYWSSLFQNRVFIVIAFENANVRMWFHTFYYNPSTYTVEYIFKYVDANLNIICNDKEHLKYVFLGSKFN